MERIRSSVQYISFILSLILLVQLGIIGLGIWVYEENKTTLSSTANNLISTINNAQEASKAVMDVAQDSGPKIQNFATAADNNKIMFKETRQKIKELEGPLREVKEILGHDNRDNLHVVLRKMRANFDRIGDDDLANLMHQGLTKENINEAMKMIGDVDSTFSKMNRMLNMLK